MTLQNANPVIYSPQENTFLLEDLSCIDIDGREGITALEIFDLIRGINDPEHPLTLVRHLRSDAFANYLHFCV